MSDALSSFLNELMAASGGKKKHISIICDNAKIAGMVPVNRRRKRSAPRRCNSSPLIHMASRWEPSSSFDFDSMNRSAETSPLRSNNGRGPSCRWPSMSEKQASEDSFLELLARSRRKIPDTRAIPEDAISIICDSAKIAGMPVNGRKKSGAPRRCVSMVHMASPSAGTSPLLSNNGRSRWESMSEKQTSADSLLGPLAITRKRSDTLIMPENATRLSDNGKTRSPKGGAIKTGTKVQDDIHSMRSASLPKSLRSLPY
jgi:hypothetical protein